MDNPAIPKIESQGTRSPGIPATADIEGILSRLRKEREAGMPGSQPPPKPAPPMTPRTHEEKMAFIERTLERLRKEREANMPPPPPPVPEDSKVEPPLHKPRTKRLFWEK